jgi:hypothetical protein
MNHFGVQTVQRLLRPVSILGLFVCLANLAAADPPTNDAPTLNPVSAAPATEDLLRQTETDAAVKSQGCVVCHRGVGDMHAKRIDGKPIVRLGCTDCHGGDAMAATAEKAHVHPCFPDAWPASGNPIRSYTLLNHESPEFIRFFNPGDLRVAAVTCGGCHPKETLAVRKSMMTHGCMLWGAALYNNGAVPIKAAHYGESYSMNGVQQRIQNVPPPSTDQMEYKAMLAVLDPLPRFEISQPGNILRIFERGGRFRPETGIPEPEEESGRPRTRLSNRGLGTANRTDPVFLGLQKTRLLDPTLNFLGTNDHAGDYRSSGCSGCHVIYANDRSPVHSGPYARFGNRGTSFSADPTIPKNCSGHPIDHQFSLSIPSSQCIVCHIHPGTTVMNSYLGFMWWDNETDGELMYPPEQKRPTAEELVRASMSNPEEASAKGYWSDPEFLEHVAELNPRARHTQFADFHGHGWVFRAVYKKDRSGNMLDYKGDIVPEVTTDKLMAAMQPANRVEQQTGKRREGLPVHLMDVHLENGMHCVDCHFAQDNHGNAQLYGEVRAAIEISCEDCHGSATERARLATSGPASPPGGHNLAALRTPFGKPRFDKRFERGRERVFQNSVVDPDLSWELVQTADTIDPSSDHYNVRSHMAKTVGFAPDGKLTWGGKPNECRWAHQKGMSCIACHSSWNPSCFGCHLPQRANMKMPALHNEGDVSKNYIAYNFQTLRDDVFMLARDGFATGNRIGPARSSCAIHVGSYNGNRESVYFQQQTISGEGLSGIAFSTNVPHTVRGGLPKGVDLGPGHVGRSGTYETKMCSDCHISKYEDNNALMAQLLMQGTNFVNFIGRYCWVAGGDKGLYAVEVTEREEPQAVIGSSLHALAYPEDYRTHVQGGCVLKHAHEHPGKDISDNVLHPFRKNEILSLQARGEYLYAACGEGGLRVFDIAFVDDKAFSERITTAPVSPLGQRFYVETKYATAVASPATIAPDPTRSHRPENHEQKVAGLYAYLYVTDKYEGLILVGAGTLLDGNPLNNFLKRDVTFNPDGLLCGARNVTIVGNYAYVCCDAGLVVVSLDDPTHPKVTCVLGNDVLKCPTAVQVQFRFGYVCDSEGIKVLDVTRLDQPRCISALPLADARSIYVARTYAYVAAGKQGLVVLDITNPPRPVVDQVYNADGCINDLCDVKMGITNASEFAYLADGCNGMRVVQLTSPETPGSIGFSPRPMPHLIASFPMPKGGRALAISKGIDRDRAVDESGNQLAVFGRVGARPLNLAEQQQMYLHDGRLWRVSDDPFDLEIYRPLVGQPGGIAPQPPAIMPRVPEDFPVPPQEPSR